MSGSIILISARFSAEKYLNSDLARLGAFGSFFFFFFFLGILAVDSSDESSDELCFLVVSFLLWVGLCEESELEDLDEDESDESSFFWFWLCDIYLLVGYNKTWKLFEFR